MEPTIVSRVAGVTIALAILSAPAFGQRETAALAPVPRQIVSARTLFVSNDGADTYGSETYYRLTRYDGGPDRLYNAYYTALKAENRFTLVGTPGEADVVIALRFANPALANGDEYSILFDPQVSARLIDPKTRIALWTLTEHIEPGRSREADNANFDHAVTRLVRDLDLLTADSASSVAARATLAAPPVGADAARHRQKRGLNLVIAISVGTMAGMAIDGRRGLSACAEGLDSCGHLRFPGAMRFTLGGMALGTLVGLLLPTN